MSNQGLDILLNKDKSKYTIKQIYNISILSANITLIVTIYFLIITYKDYENNNTDSARNFFIAAALSSFMDIAFTLQAFWQGRLRLTIAE